MKKIVFFILTSFFFFSTAWALNLNSAPKIEEAKDTSLKITWEKVGGALGYYVYYWKESVEWKTKEEKAYQSQLSDFIESTWATIPNLEANIKYYVAVTAVDENGEEWPYSAETMVSTIQSSGVKSSQNSFWLTQVSVISENQVKLSFNVDLDNSLSALREFKIIEEQTQKEVKIKNIDLVGSKNLLLTFENKLTPAIKYKLTIISLLDKDGKNIEQGIDGISTFLIPEMSGFSWGQENSIPNNLNSALPVINMSESGNNAWQNISQENINKTALNSANEANNLPKTWPEHIVLFIFSLIIWFFVFHFQKKKMENQ